MEKIHRETQASPTATAFNSFTPQGKQEPPEARLASTEIDGIGGSGRAALMLTAEQGHARVRDLLLARERAVDGSRSTGWTSLMCASLGGHVDVVERLLVEPPANEEGARNATGKDRINALMFAALKGHVRITQLLLEHGVGVNTTYFGGRTVLMIAARHGHIALVMLLLQKGAHANARDVRGETARSLASKNNHQQIVSLLDRHVGVAWALMLLAFFVLLASILIFALKLTVVFSVVTSAILASAVMAFASLMEPILCNKAATNVLGSAAAYHFKGSAATPPMTQEHAPIVSCSPEESTLPSSESMCTAAKKDAGCAAYL